MKMDNSNLPRFLVPVDEVQLCHLVDAFLVLPLDVQLEFELVQHARDLSGCEGRVGFD